MKGPGNSLQPIVDALEEDILFGRLRTRERLIEDELIERFGATRHLVRQALVELERKGMVVRQRNRGAVVRDFTREEVDQICSMRELLHAHAASLIPLPAPGRLLRRLEALQLAHAREVERGNLSAIHRANNAFHETLFAACDNRYLARTIQEYAQMSLAFRCHVMVNPFRARHARDEHAAMIDALRKGDRARLVKLCIRHTQPAREVYLAMQGLGEAARAGKGNGAAATRPRAAARRKRAQSGARAASR